jgi:hypothetical protein
MNGSAAGVGASNERNKLAIVESEEWKGGSNRGPGALRGC